MSVELERLALKPAGQASSRRPLLLSPVIAAAVVPDSA